MEKYEIGKMVGKGSFGTVYLVRRKTDGHKYVLKKMRIGKCDSPLLSGCVFMLLPL